MINDKEDEVITNAIDPLILEIYLYNNNYKDRLLISELKERAHAISVPGLDGSSFFVKVDDMYEIINSKFRKDIKDFESTPYDSLTKSVTSIFFINSMMESFSKIKYFRINVSDSQIYTRKNKDSISFDYRILHSKIDLISVCTPEFLSYCKKIFKKLGFIGSNPFDKAPYFEVSARDLSVKIRNYMTEQQLNENEEEISYILNLQLMLGTKLEKDNSIVLMIIEE